MLLLETSTPCVATLAWVYPDCLQIPAGSSKQMCLVTNCAVTIWWPIAVWCTTVGVLSMNAWPQKLHILRYCYVGWLHA